MDPESASRWGRIVCPEYEEENKMAIEAWMEYCKKDPAEYDRMIADRFSLARSLRVGNKDDWNGWQQHLDKDLTSHSDLFKAHPEYQYMYQNGYSPRDPFDPNSWEEYFATLDSHTINAIARKLFYRPRHHHHSHNRDRYNYQLLMQQQYEEQYIKSQGFDIDICLEHGYGIIRPLFNSTRPVHTLIYHRLTDYSRGALDYYNKLEGTRHTLNRVVKACQQQVNGMLYYITFEAKISKDHLKLFQAKVYIYMMKLDKVLLVRPKAMDGMPSDTQSNEMKDLFEAAKLWETYLKQINESEGFDIDVYPTNGRGIIKPMFNETSPVSAEIYDMLIYWSRISVDVYNQQEGTDYSVNRVVKVCTQVDCGIMYFITFEAIKPKHHFQVFQAKVYDPIHGENKVLLVRPKAMVKDLLMAPRDSHHDAKRLGKYVEQIKETEGFDIDECISDGDGTIVPLFYEMRFEKTFGSLMNYSRNALDVYNFREGTDYTLHRVYKACAQTVAGRTYYITFVAINSKNYSRDFQAKLYGHGIKPDKVLLVRPKAMDGMPSDTHSNKMKDLFTPPRNSHQAAKLWETYLKQIKKSEGFDIDVYPTDGHGIIKPMLDDTSPVSAEIYDMLIYWSRISVDVYNQQEGTDYSVNRVVKVCTQVDCGIMYFITFEAIKPKHHFQVFQAKVYDPIHGENKVLLVRPKAMVKDLLMAPRDSHHDAKRLGKYVEQIKETEGFDIDECISDGDGTIVPLFYEMRFEKTFGSLMNYSRNALDVYNFREGTDYTLHRVYKACAQTVAGRTYYITFVAINSKNYSRDFQAKLYGHGIKPDKVLLVRPKAMDGMPSDTHSNKMKDLFTPPRNSHQAAKLWETYLKQIKKSEGFDIDVYPTDGHGIIKPMLDDTSPVSAEIYDMLIYWSRISVDVYNQQEGTDYSVNRVVKVCTQVDCGIMYFITFEAIKPKHHFQVFQAMVYDPIHGENKLLLVRPKAMVKDLLMAPRDSHHDAKCLEKYVEQIKETEGFDIDVCISDGDGTIVPIFYDMSSAKTGDSLFNYSRNALDVYNFREGTDYTLNQVFKACAQTLAGRMYYITFGAINSKNHFQVFQAKVFDPAKGQNEVLLIRKA